MTEPSPRVGQRLVGEQVVPNRLEPLLEEGHEPLVATVELREHPIQELLHLVFPEGHDAADDPCCLLRRRWLERAV